MGQPQWVRLYLVPQTEGTNTMPPSVVGLLTSDTPSHYVLNPMLESKQDEETYEESLVPVGMNFINRTYVWRCNVLAEKPISEVDDNSVAMQEDMSGGLG